MIIVIGLRNIVLLAENRDGGREEKDRTMSSPNHHRICGNSDHLGAGQRIRAQWDLGSCKEDW